MRIIDEFVKRLHDIGRDQNLDRNERRIAVECEIRQFTSGLKSERYAKRRPCLSIDNTRLNKRNMVVNPAGLSF
ncbi:MAG: hypothetical protein HQ553_09775 [Chloroflexi bacterium]|nr:hypothetical protein [Chloroflexota bacterium]